MMGTLICFFHPRDHRLGPLRGCPLCVGIRAFTQAHSPTSGGAVCEVWWGTDEA